MTIWNELLGNQVLISAVLGWTVAQFLKTVIDMVINKSFNPERIFGSGGMPSSHSATVCALTTASGMKYGVGSFEFAISFVLSMIVMYDAMGVRRETGKQAKLLNSVFFENILNLDGVFLQEKLKEYVGHTPLQVAAGAILGILIAVLILVLLAVVAAVTGYSLVARRVKALQAGAAFTFDYEITSTADSPALYTILQKTGSTKGTVNGLYAPDALQLSISAPDAVIPAGPLTRVYISSSETLYDVGQLYKNIRSSITGSYPLASLLLPDWSLGSYISQAQLASLLGVDTTATSLQDMTEFELPQKKLQRVQPENAKDGYLYFQLDTGDARANAPVLVIGLEKSRFFADAIPVHILLTIPEHGVSIQLTGTVSAQTVVLTAPTSRMKDEDIQTLVQIRDTIQSVLQFVQTAANSVQNAG